MKPKTDPVSRLWKTKMKLVEPNYSSSYIPGISTQDFTGQEREFFGRISHTSISTVNPVDGLPVTHTIIKLICSPEVPIVQGSSLYVEERNIIYSCAGIPAKYNKHQEVVLEYQKR